MAKEYWQRELRYTVFSRKWGVVGESTENGELIPGSIRTVDVSSYFSPGIINTQNGPISVTAKEMTPTVRYKFGASVDPVYEEVFPNCNNQFDEVQQEIATKIFSEIAQRHNIAFRQVAASEDAELNLVKCSSYDDPLVTGATISIVGDGLQNLPVTILVQEPSLLQQIFIPGFRYLKELSWLTPELSVHKGTLVHEIGHGIGLSHTHNVGYAEFDASQSVMAYKELGSNLKDTEWFGPLDEYSLDSLYGPNPDFKGELRYKIGGGNDFNPDFKGLDSKRVTLDENKDLAPRLLNPHYFAPFLFLEQIFLGVVLGLFGDRINILPAIKDNDNFSQYAKGMAADVLVVGARYSFPFGAEAYDITSSIKNAVVQSAAKNPSHYARMLLDGGIAGVCEYAKHCAMRAASLALRGYMQPLLHAVYAANDLVVELKRPEKTEESYEDGGVVIDMSACKTSSPVPEVVRRGFGKGHVSDDLDDIIENRGLCCRLSLKALNRIHVFRYLPGMIESGIKEVSSWYNNSSWQNKEAERRKARSSAVIEV